MKKYLPILSGGLVLSLLLAACSSTPVPTVPTPVSVADQPSAADPLSTPLALSSVPLTDRAWISAVNGWGPAEVNRSNGEAAAGDGRTLSLRGQTYAKGLGVHAASSVKYDVTGCAGFQSDIGVDDEVSSMGQVTFEVWADGVQLYKSARLTRKSAKVAVNVSIAGRKTLTLVVTDGGNGVDGDHGDWAGATLLGCPAPAPAPAPTVWVTAANEYGSFSLGASTQVQFGLNSSWVSKTLGAGTYVCNAATFGSDPLVGSAKVCQVPQGTVTTAPTPTLAPAPTSVVYSKPITITQGGTYSGNWESTDPAVPAITVQTSQPVVIENSRIRGVGHYGLIEGFGNDLTVRGSTFTGIRPNVRGLAVPRALSLAEVHNVSLEHNTFDHTAGVYLYLYRGNGTLSNTVTIRYNLATNADGRQSDGAGGLIPGNVSHSLTNFVQFNQLQGLPGADISWNQSTDEAYKSLSEDKVNMYVSSGTAASPIRIHDNLIQGAYNADPANDPSFSGGGIILGDGPVTAPEQSAHIWAYGNTVLDTTNYGMAIVGGSDMKIYNNRILSTGVLPDGRHVLAQNVGLYVWDYGNAGSLMQGNVASDNVLFWRKWDQAGTPVNNPWWLPDCTAARASTCTGNTVPTSADMAAEVQAWQTRVAAAGYSIGASR